MVRIEDRTFNRQVVTFDGIQYVRCTFTECRLVFTGSTIPNMVDCQLMGDCAWTFEGAATTTFSFLNILYNSGPAGRALVDSLVQMIRAELPAQPPVETGPATAPDQVH